MDKSQLVDPLHLILIFRIFAGIPETDAGTGPPDGGRSREAGSLFLLSGEQPTYVSNPETDGRVGSEGGFGLGKRRGGTR